MAAHTLAVVGLSARLMAEAAAREGFDVVALDLFGDLDTRAVATQWVGIGTPGTADSGPIDEARLLDALATLAHEAGTVGWVVGSGLESRPDVLARGAALLPLVGTGSEAVARVRDPHTFFAHLARHGIAHPPVQWSVPADGKPWLLKDAGGSGGRGVRRAARRGPPAPAAAPVSSLPAGHYYQRVWPGLPMSATFVAEGERTRVLGVNRQLVCEQGERPYVFSGLIGPVPAAESLRQRVHALVCGLATAFELRGLGSLDFLLDGDELAVLEINPRVPASVGLYADHGPMRAHVAACGASAQQANHRRLEAPRPALETTARPGVTDGTGGTVRGYEIVFAAQALHIDAAHSAVLGAMRGVHDRPSAGQYIRTGEPVCSISACADSLGGVQAALARQRERVVNTLEEFA